MDTKIWLSGLGILITGAIVAGAFAGRTPLLQAPDEPAHYSYAATVWEGPVIAESDWRPDAVQAFIVDLKRTPWGGCQRGDDGYEDSCFPHLTYEDHQPPLYYSLASQGFTGRSGLLPTWLDSAFRIRDQVEDDRLVAVRRTSLIMSLITLVLTFDLLATTFPSMPSMRLAATAFIAFLPMYAYMSAVVNNDALAHIVMALALLAAVRRLSGRITRRRYVVWAGLIWGAALLTKLTVYPVILPLVAAEFLRTRREGLPIRDAVTPAAASGALGLLIAAPWFIRNMFVYGLTDPFGLAAHDRVVVGQPRTADWIAEHGWGAYIERAVVFTFDSFWGVFGWMAAFMDRRIYIALAVASVGMTIGFTGYVRRAWGASRTRRGIANDPIDGVDDNVDDSGGEDGGDHVVGDDVGPLQRDVLVVFGLVVATTVGGFVWYNLTFVQHQGRYLFPALIPIATAAMLGIREWARWVARAVRRPEWAGRIAVAGMAAFDVGLLATSVWALVYVIPTLWPNR